MPRLLVVILVLLSAVLSARSESEGLPSARNKTYHGYYYFLDEKGDTTLMLVINNVTVFPPERFKNKEREQFYWRMVRDVRKGLPYAKLISATVIETYEYISTFDTKKEREDYLKQMEHEVFNQYKPELKRFTRQQARVLVKLINRETNQESFSIIRAFLGSFRATCYQALGRISSVNLKADWNPESDCTDALIDRIATRIEQGEL